MNRALRLLVFIDRALRLLVGLGPAVVLFVLAARSQRLKIPAGLALLRVRDFMDCDR